MQFNGESVALMVKFALAMLALLGVVFLLACATPWMAKQVDKLRAKLQKDKTSEGSPEEQTEFPDVPGIYDAQIPDDAEDKNSGASDAEETKQKEEQR